MRETYIEIDNVGWINTVESILGRGVIFANNFYIPIFNIQVFESLPENENIVAFNNIDLCILYFEGVKYLSWDDENIDSKYKGRFECFGGGLFNDINIYSEFWIDYSSAKVLLPKDFKSVNGITEFHVYGRKELEFLSYSAVNFLDDF